MTEHWVLPPNGWVPNAPEPVVLHRAVLPQPDAERWEALLARNGWPADWRNGVFPFHHYHSTAHEALGVAAGSAELVLGGEGGRVVQLAAGDLLVLPAGTGHCRLSASPDFLLVGAYPAGQRWDVCRAAPTPEQRAAMAALPVPRCDPAEGRDGAVPRLWRAARLAGP